ncbi:MAG TPA: hypothetical protein VMT17_11155 [Anaeromyxobacteraceae bacterium]|nr:hypothetical protein [Anaeromyxobacteraceae bacterium]
MFTVERLGVRVAVSVPCVSTVTCAVAAPVETVAALFASVPLADALKTRVVALDDEQPP